MRATLGFADSWMHAHPQDEQSGKGKRDSGKRKQKQHSLACGARLQPAPPSGLSFSGRSRSSAATGVSALAAMMSGRALPDDEWASATVFRFSWSLTFEVSRHRRRGVLDSKRKMGRRPSA